MTQHARIPADRDHEALIDSPYAWIRLGVSVLLATIGGVGMWSVVVALPAVQSEFGVDRGDASLPYTLTMLGFGVAGIAMGRFADRFGIALVVAGGALALALGYVAAGFAPTLWLVTVAQLVIGIGSAATFGPLIADVSHWFLRRRGIAVSICAAGNYLSGTVWPSLLQHFIDTVGWRQTYIGVGLFCVATMVPLVLALRRRAVLHDAGSVAGGAGERSLGLSPNALLALLCVAGVACCTAMSMPQVHIVAYCGDLGYGVQAGAVMLSLMLGFGIVSRVTSGWIADRLGGVATLLLGSALQGTALLLYLSFSGLNALYVISALFGLFQGGLVPSYAIIIREYFPAREAGAKVGIVLLATLVGMAFGGWISGVIFDWTGSYQAAFANGLGWNLLNGAIALFLLLRQGRRPAFA